MPHGSYHHGDLANALLAEAIHLIADEGVDALSLRKLGERAGVSRSALYRHFRDKGALLAAVAEEGFGILRERLASARSGPGGTLERFQAMGVAYVGFATERPSHYRVMFSPALDRTAHPDLAAASTAAFDELRGAIEQGQAGGEMREGPARELAYSAWATVHGLALLGIDRQIHPDLARDALARSATRTLIEGLARRGPTDPTR